MLPAQGSQSSPWTIFPALRKSTRTSTASPSSTRLPHPSHTTICFLKWSPFRIGNGRKLSDRPEDLN